PFHSPSTIPVGVEAASEIARRIVPGGGQQLVFVNGRYAADLSDPPRDGVTLGALSSLPDVGGRLVERHLGSYLPYDRVAFTPLNAALLSDVATVHVPKGRALAEPIYLTFIAISDDDLT